MPKPKSNWISRMSAIIPEMNMIRISRDGTIRLVHPRTGRDLIRRPALVKVKAK